MKKLLNKLQNTIEDKVEEITTPVLAVQNSEIY